MNLMKISLLSVALLAMGTQAVAETTAPNCAGTLTGPLVVGMDLTASGSGAPWESVSNGTVVGFDVSVIQEVAAILGYTGVQIVNIASGTNDACLFAAITAGQIPVAISDIEIPTAGVSGIAFIKYNDSTTAGSQGKGIAVNAQCCQLYANIAQAIANMVSNGDLAALRTEFNITPNSYTAVSGLTPTACASTQAALPTRNAISNWILENLCIAPGAPTAPTSVTPVPTCPAG